MQVNENTGITEGAMIIIQNKEIRDLLAEKGAKINLLNSVIEDALMALMVQIFGPKQIYGEGEDHFTWTSPEEYVPLPGTESLIKIATDMNIRAYGEIRCTPLIQMKKVEEVA